MLPVKCWHCNHGKALTRAGGEKGPEKALWAAHCLFMAVRAPVRRVMTGHYLFVVLSRLSGAGKAQVWVLANNTTASWHLTWRQLLLPNISSHWFETTPFNIKSLNFKEGDRKDLRIFTGNTLPIIWSVRDMKVEIWFFCKSKDRIPTCGFSRVSLSCICTFCWTVASKIRKRNGRKSKRKWLFEDKTKQSVRGQCVSKSKPDQQLCPLWNWVTRAAFPKQESRFVFVPTFQPPTVTDLGYLGSGCFFHWELMG